MIIEKKLPSKIPDLLGLTNQKFTTQLGIINTINGLSNKLCVPNKTEDLNISALNMVTGINKLKTLSKHISCKCKCKFDGIKCNSS